MNEGDPIVTAFEEQRPHLRAVAYRMLGSTGEADDAVQEAWLRLSRVSAGEIENLGGWLTTVVARICLNMLRSRSSRREQSLDDLRMPDLIVDPLDGTDPEHEALLADSVGIAMLIVLGTLNPAERLAFVLHDMFGVPFEEIAPIVDRTPGAARQLASRGRRRLQAADPVPDADLEEQRGVEAVIAQARSFATLGAEGHMVRVNGGIGTVAFLDGVAISVGAVQVRAGRIVEIDFLADQERLAELDLDRFAL